MRPADACRLKYRSDGSASQTIEPSNTAGVDSLPDELLARILSPVDLKSLVQARAVCKSWKASVEGKAVSDLRGSGSRRSPRGPPRPSSTCKRRPAAVYA